ncbi:MAG TPA: DUF308 domain-containing protein [Dongiaceae bacterium]|nr:DUF308 domain-containing protein [Dongiaceae bacterium]
MATSITTFAKEEVRWSMVASILMILAGMLAIFVPPAAGLAATIIVGVLLVFSGIAHVVFGWETRGAGAMVWQMLLGVLYVLVGGYLLFHLGTGLSALTLALAMYLLLGAILEFALAVKLRPLPGSGWLFVDGIISLIMAVLIWRTWPSNTPWVIGMLVGIAMLFSGSARLALSMRARTIVAKLA